MSKEIKSSRRDQSHTEKSEEGLLMCSVLNLFLLKVKLISVKKIEF